MLAATHGTTQARSNKSLIFGFAKKCLRFLDCAHWWCLCKRQGAREIFMVGEIEAQWSD